MYFLVIGRLNCGILLRGRRYIFIYLYLFIYLFIYIYLCMSNKAQDTPQSVGLLRTSDRSFSEISTWQQATFTGDRHPCPWRNSHPQSQEASDRRTTPETARPPGLAVTLSDEVFAPFELNLPSVVLWYFLFIFVSVNAAASLIFRKCDSRPVGSVSEENYILCMS